MNPHNLAYSMMPESASANPFANQQYINGHFCYAFKAGILTNGLGISFFDENLILTSQVCFQASVFRHHAGFRLVFSPLCSD